jgi:hypothetical protein
MAPTAQAVLPGTKVRGPSHVVLFGSNSAGVGDGILSPFAIT